MSFKNWKNIPVIQINSFRNIIKNNIQNGKTYYKYGNCILRKEKNLIANNFQ